MKIDANVNLAAYSTMGLGGNAAYLCTISNRNEVAEAHAWAKSQNIPSIMIGGGSNIIWRDEGYPGLVIVNNILGYEIHQEDETIYFLTIGSGEIWDSVVMRTVGEGLTGIEALSLIPGKTGATPVQNVGAYGQDISQTLSTIEAYDNQLNKLVIIPASDCKFGYRTSRFKSSDYGRFYITAITLQLIKGNPTPPYYSSVQEYFDENNIIEITPIALRKAVIAIRSEKLPDPAVNKNSGSYFSNPIVSDEILTNLRSSFINIPSWQVESGNKLSAAWLIENAGFKDFHDPETGIGVWPMQSLVLINENASSTADLLKFKDKVVNTVNTKFGIKLSQEPELLPKY